MPKIGLKDVDINYRIDTFVDPWAHIETDTVVLMHHGFSRNLKFWTKWVPTLAGTFTVLRYDARGCGESSFPEEPFPLTLEMLAEDAAALMDSLGIANIHWVGALSGGLVGQVFAVLYPERIKSLTLCYAPCKIHEKLNDSLTVGKDGPAAAVDKIGVREWRAKTVGASMDLSKAEPNLVEWSVDEIAKTPKHVALSYLNAYHGRDMSERLCEIKAPTLIMLGDRSKIVPPEMRDFMQEQIPNSRLCVFPGISDGIDLLIPDKCAEEALNFITEVS